MILKDLCFEIIEKCTNNCRFCSSCSSIDKDKIISFTDFKRVVDYFCEKDGIEEISFSGGEPLLHPNIFEMLKYCKDKSIKTTIYTSGVLQNTEIEIDSSIYSENEIRIIEKLNKEKFTSISKEILNGLKNCNLSRIIFDLQSIKVDNYNYLMGTKNNISYVLTSMILYVCK